jgi:MSHA biogenesis protein MshE
MFQSLSSDPMIRPRLGDLLVAKRLVTEEQLAEALVEARGRGVLVGRVLIDRRWVFDDELARTLAEQLSLPFLNLAVVGVDEKAVKLLPRDVGLRWGAIPVRMLPTRVQVAFADPSDPDARRTVDEYIPGVEPAVAPLSDVENAWRSIAAS